MLCSHCRTTLEREREQGTFAWRCGGCGRVVLTLGALRRRVGPSVWNAVRRAAIAAEEDGDGSCPACKRSWVAAETDGRALHYCRHCQLVCGDRLLAGTREPGELSHIAKASVAQVQAGLRQGRARETMLDWPRESWKRLLSFLGLFFQPLGVCVSGIPFESEAKILRRPPWATWILAASVAVISWLCFGDFAGNALRYGFLPDEPLRDGGLGLVSGIFLHESVWHLGLNLFLLVVFCNSVEDALGWRRFLLLVFAANACGVLLHALLDPNGFVPLYGAGASVWGLLVYAGLRQPLRRVGFLWWPLVAILWIRVRMRALLALCILLIVIGAANQLDRGAGGPYLKLLGGMAAGGLLWLRWRTREVPSPFPAA